MSSINRLVLFKKLFQQLGVLLTPAPVLAVGQGTEDSHHHACTAAQAILESLGDDCAVELGEFVEVDGMLTPTFLNLVAQHSCEMVNVNGDFLELGFVLSALHEYQYRYNDEDDLLLNSNNKSYLEEFVADVAFDLCEAYPINEVTYAIKSAIAKHRQYADGKPIAPFVIGLCELQTIIKKWLGKYASLVIGVEYL